MQIQLTETESHVCKLLDGCTKYLAAEKGINTSCRVAGGWVRDKLLAVESHDIDIALSDMMGVPFAEHLRDYALSNGIETGHITKIEQNPDQSKHLETATLKVFGLDIDLVNLRSEEYTEGSRIPSGIAFGTPLEDALRRDITINALFYNVHSGQVEDFTERGLDDLRNGIIRTPLPPRETFLDDPLRVLRCVRFASRLGFEVIEDVKEAARDPVVKRALIEKVSRERVGDEVTKMIQGRDPLRSAQLIGELDLYHPIFSVIPEIAKAGIPKEFFQAAPQEGLAAVSILHTVTSPDGSDLVRPHSDLVTPLRKDHGAVARLYLAALLLPWKQFTHVDSKKKTQSTVAAVIRESLKLGTQNHYLDGVPALFDGIQTLKDGLRKFTRENIQRAPLGVLLRNKSVHNPLTGNQWTTSLLFSMVTDLVPHYRVNENAFDEQATKVIQQYTAFTKRVIELGLQNDVDSKPVVNGKEIVAAFGVSRVGPWVGKVLEDVVEWQLQNPDKHKEDCIEWLRARGVDYYVSVNERRDETPAKRPRKTERG
ncbi:hypothetical protein CPB83DRAFT_842268 [Crepidotus variabilis]|uniref:tRNA nucleotidyltransferase n=1 Tax=Crepidotus variabilis TaxID=179855 RepID=A0A9P6ET77_9AGAR|nr:hypothetical protein CPB83DRAFT_842268 [Crepidotus variabilis]